MTKWPELRKSMDPMVSINLFLWSPMAWYRSFHSWSGPVQRSVLWRLYVCQTCAAVRSNFKCQILRTCVKSNESLPDTDARDSCPHIYGHLCRSLSKSVEICWNNMVVVLVKSMWMRGQSLVHIKVHHDKSMAVPVSVDSVWLIFSLCDFSWFLCSFSSTELPAEEGKQFNYWCIY